MGGCEGGFSSLAAALTPLPSAWVLWCQAVGVRHTAQGCVCAPPVLPPHTCHTLVTLSAVILKVSHPIWHLYYNIYEILLVTFISFPDPIDLTSDPPPKLTPRRWLISRPSGWVIGVCVCVCVDEGSLACK